MGDRTAVHQMRAKLLVALAKRARKNAREHTSVLKGLLRIRRYNQQETPYALQKAELFFWLQFGEAYSALRGWRPIPAALPSHSVLLCSGTEDNSLPTPRPFDRSPYQGRNIPDKTESIRKTTCSVKFLSQVPSGNLCGNQGLGRFSSRSPPKPLPAHHFRAPGDPSAKQGAKSSPQRKLIFA